jgi:hypothetical protein
MQLDDWQSVINQRRRKRVSDKIWRFDNILQTPGVRQLRAFVHDKPHCFWRSNKRALVNFLEEIIETRHAPLRTSRFISSSARRRFSGRQWINDNGFF